MNKPYIVMLSIIGILTGMLAFTNIPIAQDKLLDISKCSLELDADGKSNIELQEELYSGRTFRINIYYCKVEGFDEIRLVDEGGIDYPENIKVPNFYEFVLRQGKKASITFLVEINEEQEFDKKALISIYGKKIEGIKSLMLIENSVDLKHYFAKVYVTSDQLDGPGLRLYPILEDYSKTKVYLSDMKIVSDECYSNIHV